MNDPTILVDQDHLSGLLNDPVMIRIVPLLNLASLSILELPEYGFMARGQQSDGQRSHRVR